jgi:hypothetical protein
VIATDTEPDWAVKALKPPNLVRLGNRVSPRKAICPAAAALERKRRSKNTLPSVNAA